MRLKSVRLRSFKRYHDLNIEGLPEEARLVVLAGPNGCGKSSLFDAFSFSHYSLSGRNSWDGLWDYYTRPGSQNTDINSRISLEFFGNVDRQKKGNFYFRSAYRQEADFTLKNLVRVGDPTEEETQIRKMMAADISVSKNYQRLASQALVDAFADADEKMTLAQFRDNVIGELRRTVAALFPDLDLNSLGNPLEDGTFRFNKGLVSGFKYKNLSGGEKAAFDIILDIIVKKNAYGEAIYCIDEPELHMNTRLQGKLLEAMLAVIPSGGQLWIATHSIGMMRKAQELWRADPLSVAFLDFGSIDPDVESNLQPSRPTQRFWEGVLAVALDDLAELIAPRRVVVCEGNPRIGVIGKNTEFDAICYNKIFAEEFPDVRFISGGSSSSVVADRLGLVKAVPMIAKGMSVFQLIDRDDHAAEDIEEFGQAGIHVLSRRHIECFLYDDEIIKLLCIDNEKEELLDEILAAKAEAIEDSIRRGRPPDDIKSAAGPIYVRLKQILKLTGVGNDQVSFSKNTLAPLIRPGGATYEELKLAVFGPQ